MAGQGQETEFKVKVESQGDLDAIGRAAGGRPMGTAKQVNHFLDDQARNLDKNKHVLRVRDEDGVFFLTAKGPGTRSADGTLSSKAEEEIKVDTGVATRILKGELSAFDVLQDGPGSSPARAKLIETMKGILQGPLREVGSFENQRTRWPASIATEKGQVDVMLELDRVTFPGNVTHYELELEVPAGADPEAVGKALQTLLAKAGVVGKSSPSKAKRFFAALEGKPI